MYVYVTGSTIIIIYVHVLFIICISTYTGTPKPECPYLPNPENGTVSIIPGGKPSVGSTANYECDPGCTLIGNRTRICQINGRWSGKAPICDCM